MNKKDQEKYKKLALLNEEKKVPKGWVYVGKGAKEGLPFGEVLGHKSATDEDWYNYSETGGCILFWEYICPQKIWEETLGSSGFRRTKSNIKTMTPRKKAAPSSKPAAPKVITVTDQLENLPSPYKELSIYAAVKQGVSNYLSGSKSSALTSFIWEETESGSYFWEETLAAWEDDEEWPEIPSKAGILELKGFLPDYPIILNKKDGSLSAGCQTIPREKVVELFNAMQDFFDF
jgi:hypothetical protein